MMLRISALVIFLLGGMGVLLHSGLIPKKHIHAGFFCYYTNLSNALVVLYELLLGVSGHRPAGWLFRFLSAPGTALTVTLCIFVTHLVFHWVLVPTARKYGEEGLKALGAGTFSNVWVHYLTPLMVVAQWLLWQDKTGLGLRHAVSWLVLPLTYFAFAMLRARTGKPIGKTNDLYPYPFLDYPRLGAKKFWLYIAGMMAVFLVLGCLLVGAAHLLVR